MPRSMFLLGLMLAWLGMSAAPVDVVGFREEFDLPPEADRWQMLERSTGVTISGGAAFLSDGNGLVTTRNVPSQFDLHCRIAFLGATNDSLLFLIGADSRGPS